MHAVLPRFWQGDHRVQRKAGNQPTTTNNNQQQPNNKQQQATTSNNKQQGCPKMQDCFDYQW